MGAKPTLPPPKEGRAKDRANEMFSRWARDETVTAPAALSVPKPSSPCFGGGRRYDLALAAAGMQAAEEETPHQLPPAAPAKQADLRSTLRPGRPPPGAPTVRPPAKRQKAEPVPQDLLESTADSMLLVSEPDGSSAFEVSIRDDLFDELTCRISWRDGGLVAEFRAADVDLRRLLAAESGRLRVRLEEKGIRVAEVLVREG